MFDLKSKKLEIFKQFVIGEGFEAKNFSDTDFSVNLYSEKNVNINLDVTKAFGYLSTDEEYNYIKAKKEVMKDGAKEEIPFVANIKSKLIDSISFNIKGSTLVMSLGINVYSRDIRYPDKRDCNRFNLEEEYASESIEIVYDVKDLVVKNNILNLDGGTKPLLKSVDGSLDLNLFTQLDNLNPRIYLYMYIELIGLMQRNKIGSFNTDELLDGIRITSHFDVKETFSKVSNNKISCEDFKSELEEILGEGLMFIPLVSIYDLNLLMARKGYYFPENSIHLEEFEGLVNLTEGELLAHYGLGSYKGYKMLVRKNMENIYYIKRLESMNFKYKEIINILASLSLDNMRTDNIFNGSFVEKYISVNSRKEAMKKLFYYKGCLGAVKDTIDMLETIMHKDVEVLKKYNIAKERISYENVDKYFNFRLNIKNLEAEVIEVYNLVEDTEDTFYYTEKEGANSEFFEYNLPGLDYKYSEYEIYKNGEYSLWLPLNSGIVKKIGKELGLCIANYVKKVRNQEVVLLFMKKGSKYIGCVEVDSKYETLVQAKIRYNKRFNKDEQEIIYSFCRENEMEICTEDIVSEYNTIENYKRNIAI